MRIVADESVEAYLIIALIKAGHSIYDISTEHPSLGDDKVLQIAFQRGEVLLTNDKDFGDLVFLHDQPHRGVILMRLYGMKPAPRTARMVMIIGSHEEQLRDAFTTVRNRSIRIRPRS